MSYMYVYCSFKFLVRVNPRINSLTLETENTKTLTYNFSSLIVRKSDLDINMIFLWHFKPVFFIPGHFSIESTYNNT